MFANGLNESMGQAVGLAELNPHLEPFAKLQKIPKFPLIFFNLEIFYFLFKFGKFGYVISVPVDLKLLLHKTHPPDFWYVKRYGQYLLPYQKSGEWVVCRRSFKSTGTLTPFFLEKFP